MPSSPLGTTHGRTTLGVKRHYTPWKAYTIGRRMAWHVIITLSQHTQQDHEGRGMPAWPLDNIRGRMTSVMSFNHHNWETHIVGRRQTWHAILPLGITYSRTTFVACHHRP